MGYKSADSKVQRLQCFQKITDMCFTLHRLEMERVNHRQCQVEYYSRIKLSRPCVPAWHVFRCKFLFNVRTTRNTIGNRKFIISALSKIRIFEQVSPHCKTLCGWPLVQVLLSGLSLSSKLTSTFSVKHLNIVTELLDLCHQD